MSQALRTRGLRRLWTLGLFALAFAAPLRAEPRFSYDLYCNERGWFTYDGAALALVKRPAHLRQVYADAERGDARARELVRELELEFQGVGAALADETSGPRCLVAEFTGCLPRWAFFDELLGSTAETERLRTVLVESYEKRARQRGIENRDVLSMVNLMLAGTLAKGVVARASDAEARGVVSRELAEEAAAASAAPIRKVGALLESVEDVFANPALLSGKTPADLLSRLSGGVPKGWRVAALGKGSHKGEGFILREYASGGTPSGRMIQRHPGGGHHGASPYWKVSSPALGTARVGPQFE